MKIIILQKTFTNKNSGIYRNYATKKKYLKALHLNISSLPYHCSELHSLLSSCKINFDITKISESKVKRNQRALQNIDIPNYNIEYYPTEGSYGGTLIYIRKGII